MEVFKDIEGFEGLYQISNLGNVKSLKGVRERILKANPNTYGYLQVGLQKDGKRYARTVHRLVAMAFLPNEYNKPDVNHLDGDKYNNCVDNLEWATEKENVNHAVETGLLNTRGSGSPLAKLTDEDVKYIRKVYKARDKEFGSRSLGRKFGVDHKRILSIVKGESY